MEEEVKEKKRSKSKKRTPADAEDVEASPRAEKRGKRAAAGEAAPPATVKTPPPKTEKSETDGHHHRAADDDDEKELPAFSLADVTARLCEAPPEFLDVRDEQLSLALLGDVERGMLDDMINYFLVGEGVKADERRQAGPAKWRYSEADEFDHFDFYSAFGCPNCGASYDLDLHQSIVLNPPALACHSCGHRACPMHFDCESEAVVDRIEARDPTERIAAKGSCAAGHGSISKTELFDDNDDGTPSSSSKETDGQMAVAEVEEHCAKQRVAGAVYLRGSRMQYYFGQSSKEWWQSQFLPRSIRMHDLHRTLTMIGMMAKVKAPTIDELCEVCGWDKAYFHTYQARSADEGMTIMYECTRCHARKTFNN